MILQKQVDNRQRNNLLFFRNIRLLNENLKWIILQSKFIMPKVVLITLLNSIISLCNVYTAIVMKYIVDYALKQSEKEMIFYIVILLMIMFGRILLYPIISVLTSRTSITLSNALQRKMYCHICNSRYNDISKYHSMNLVSRTLSDINMVVTIVVNTIPQLISIVVSFFLALYVLARLSFLMATVSLISCLILFLINSKMNSKFKMQYKDIQNQQIKYSSFIQETFKNLIVIKAFRRENNNVRILDNIQYNMASLTVKNNKTISMSTCLATLYSTFTYSIVFIWSIVSILNAKISYGEFTAILQLYNNVQAPINSLAQILPMFSQCSAAIERIKEIENIDLENLQINSIQEAYDVNRNKYNSEIDVEFKGVCFSYDKNKKILNGIDLKIKSGETIAIIGASGSGKTTLAKLLLSLFQCDSGEILLKYENKNIECCNRDLISYIPQGNTLFSGTIKENISLGNSNATDEEVKEALYKSCALDFIKSLEEGVNTVIGENGIGISEGQSQRIAIARGLIKKAPILLLDEVTSSLDEETECRIISAISELSYKPTCIIITHRPAALSICDKVYRLENGTLEQVNLPV